MKGGSRKWIILGLFLLTHPLHAYWSNTHQKFAQDAYDGNEALSGVEGSESIEDYYANRLGFPLDRDYIFDNIEPLKICDDCFLKPVNGMMARTIYSDKKTGTEIFIQGSDDEDYPTARATNHFYDPAHNQSLGESIAQRKEYLTVWSQYDDLIAGFTAWSRQAIKTPDWALEDNGEAPSYQLTDGVTGDVSTEMRQNHSLRDSYDYLYKALTATDLDTRKKAMGEHIYALGHVIHLLTDMGQPEHVRNDVHLASLYEKQTEKLAEKDGFTFLPYFFDSGIKYDVKRDSFKKARDYFHTTTDGSGIGIAEFTNRNFVSPTTNFEKTNSSPPTIKPRWYTLPSALPEDPTNWRTADQLYTELGDPLPNDIFGDPLVGKVQFVETTIDDKQSPVSNTTNYRAASHSIFNAEVNMYLNECFYIGSNKNSSLLQVESEIVQSLVTDPNCKQYTLNRWNYIEFRRYLAPRIVGYGAAFLKHLARGTMEMRRPSSFDLKDLQIDPNTGDITRLPIALKNTTSSGDAMDGGKLAAVVTYVDDSSGEVVEVFSSEDVAATSLQNSAFETKVFQFVEKNADGSVFVDGNGNTVPAAFPLNIPGTTAYVQVVYRGKLGDEDDIVVVARKPLSEIITPDPLPNSGAYALVDHLPGWSGFDKMTLKLYSEKPLDGTILPVAMHHINNCYQDDLTGEYNVGGQQTRLCNTSDYRSDKTYYTAASELLGSSVTATPQEIDVNFHLPIPFSATDLWLALYHYPADPSAPVGVSFIDISEPTYISIINNTDHYAINGTYYSIEEMLAGDMRTFVENTNIYATPLDIDISVNGIPSIKIADLPAGGYSRFAVLTSPRDSGDTFLFSLVASSSNFRASLSTGLTGAISQLDSSTNLISRSYLPMLRNVIGHYYIKLEQPYLGGIVGNESTLPAIDSTNQTAITLVQP